MTPSKFRSIREKLDLTQSQMARALGYARDANSSISRFESGERIPKPFVTRLMLMFERHGVPPYFLQEKNNGKN